MQACLIPPQQILSWFNNNITYLTSGTSHWAESWGSSRGGSAGLPDVKFCHVPACRALCHKLCSIIWHNCLLSDMQQLLHCLAVSARKSAWSWAPLSMINRALTSRDKGSECCHIVQKNKVISNLIGPQHFTKASRYHDELKRVEIWEPTSKSSRNRCLPSDLQTPLPPGSPAWFPRHLPSSFWPEWQLQSHNAMGDISTARESTKEQVTISIVWDFQIDIRGDAHGHARAAQVPFVKWWVQMAKSSTKKDSSKFCWLFAALRCNFELVLGRVTTTCWVSRIETQRSGVNFGYWTQEWSVTQHVYNF